MKGSLCFILHARKDHERCYYERLDVISERVIIPGIYKKGQCERIETFAFRKGSVCVYIYMCVYYDYERTNNNNKRVIVV